MAVRSFVGFDLAATVLYMNFNKLQNISRWSLVKHKTRKLNTRLSSRSEQNLQIKL